MKRGLKRNIQTYLLYTLWIGLSCYSLTTNTSAFGQRTLILVIFVSGLTLLHMLVKRNYFEVINGRLIINRSFFQTKIIDLDSIEKVVIEAGPFSTSKIILKDKKRIKYWHNEMNDKRCKELMGELNIPVE